MDQHGEPLSTGREAGTPAGAPRRAGRRGIRRLLTLPIALASAVAVTLGVVQPAAAAPQTVKRHPKPRSSSGTPLPRR